MQIGGWCLIMGILKKENLSQKKLEMYHEWCKIVQWGRRNPA